MGRFFGRDRRSAVRPRHKGQFGREQRARKEGSVDYEPDPVCGCPHSVHSLAVSSDRGEAWPDAFGRSRGNRDPRLGSGR